MRVPRLSFQLSVGAITSVVPLRLGAFATLDLAGQLEIAPGGTRTARGGLLLLPDPEVGPAMFILEAPGLLRGAYAAGRGWHLRLTATRAMGAAPGAIVPRGVAVGARLLLQHPAPCGLEALKLATRHGLQLQSRSPRRAPASSASSSDLLAEGVAALPSLDRKRLDHVMHLTSAHVHQDLPQHRPTLGLPIQRHF